jgi:four helix bundle protein
VSSSFQDLRVWQQAMTLAAAAYKATELFPKPEVYGITSQIRRAAVSVASNIAEGKGHRSDREFLHFLYHARGSLFELETQILLAQRLQYVSEEGTKELIGSVTVVARSLTGLINSLAELHTTAGAVS